MQRLVWHFWFAIGFYFLTSLLYVVTMGLDVVASAGGCNAAPLALLPAAPTPSCIASWIVHGRDWMVAALSPLLHLEEQMVTEDQFVAMAEPASVAAVLYAIGITIARRFAHRIAPRTAPAVAAFAGQVWLAVPVALRTRRRATAPV